MFSLRKEKSDSRGLKLQIYAIGIDDTSLQRYRCVVFTMSPTICQQNIDANWTLKAVANTISE